MRKRTETSDQHRSTCLPGEMDSLRVFDEIIMYLMHDRLLCIKNMLTVDECPLTPNEILNPIF